MDDGIFISKMRDVLRLCEKYHAPRFSRFLDSREQAILENNGIFGTLFGGYDGAERCMLGAFPDFCEPCGDLFPIDVLKAMVKNGESLSHRQYLGTILSLGIERDKIGDILIDGGNAYIFLCSDISEFVKENVSKIGKCGVFLDYADINAVELPSKKFEIISCVCASLRLDAVLSGLMNKSRNDAKSLISGGKVFVNHFDIQKTDFAVKEGDLLSVRGFGRAQIEEIGAKTRSDRIHIKFKKYV